MQFKYLQKICRQQAEGFEQVNLQTVQGQAPIKTFLQTKHMVTNNSSQKLISYNVIERTDYLPLLVTLCLEGRIKSRERTGNRQKIEKNTRVSGLQIIILV